MRRGNADFGVPFFINVGINASGVDITGNSSYNNNECIGQKNDTSFLRGAI